MKIVAVAALAVALTASSFAATSTTGNLAGTVRDSSGAPLRGAHVKLSRAGFPAVNTETDPRGEYRFLYLEPHEDYVLTVEKDGFERVAMPAVVVRLGADVGIDFDMRPMTSTEITVSAAPPLIDAKSSVSTTNITSEQFSAFPTGRNFQQLTVLAPGTRMDRDALSPAINGATLLENDYVIEGISTRALYDSRSATNLTMDFVDEVEVMTGGLTAEYGRALGGVINVLTKAGTNRVRANAAMFFRDADWSSESPTYASHGTTYSDQRHDLSDWAVSLSGPISRDRAWFFAAYNPRHDSTPVHYLDPSNEIDFTYDTVAVESVFTAKTNVAISPSQSLTLAAFGNPTDTHDWIGGALSDPSAALYGLTGGSRNYSARYDAAIGARTGIDLIAGRHRKHVRGYALTELGATVPFQQDYTNGWSHGGIGEEGSNESTRSTFSLATSQFLERHEIRYGVNYEQNRWESTRQSDAYYYYGVMDTTPEIGPQDVLAHQNVDGSGYGAMNETSAFVQDRIRIAANVTVNAGLRWERQVLGSGRGVRVITGLNADGSVTDAPASSFTFDDNWAPRLGIAWDPSGRGHARVYASAGRFFESIPLQIAIDAMNGVAGGTNWYYSTERHTSDNWWNPSGPPSMDGWVLYASDPWREPSSPVPIDPTTRMQYQDEYGIGADYQVGSATTFGIHYTDRQIKRVLEDHLLYDPNDLSKRRGYIISNFGEGEYGSDLQRPTRHYQAIELTAQRRLTNHWQLVSSFVAARERGDYDGLYFYANYWPAPNNTPELELPRFRQNSYGAMRGDRPYEFKLHSSYAFANGLTVSEAFSYVSGPPMSKFLRFPGRAFGGGVRWIYATPRGSEGRSPDIWNLDLHADWRLPLLKQHGVAASLVADVFNATDNHIVTEVDQDYTYPGMPGIRQWLAPSNLDEWGVPKYDPSLPHSAYYGTPSAWTAPRAVQLGVRLTY